MYTQILGKLNVGDTYRINGVIYIVTQKPFGKWIVSTDPSGKQVNHKSSALVEVVNQQSEISGEEKEIDWDL